MYSDILFQPGYELNVHFPEKDFSLLTGSQLDVLIKHQGEKKSLKGSVKAKNWVSIPLDDLKTDHQEILEVQIMKIQNPLSANIVTGNFQVEILKGINILESHYHFGKISFTPLPINMETATLQILSNPNVNQLSSIEIDLTLNNADQNFPANSKLSIFLGTTLTLQSDSSSTVSLAVNHSSMIDTLSNRIDLILESSSQTSQLKVTLSKVKNASVQKSIAQVIIFLLEPFTQTIVQQFILNSSLQIQPLLISSSEIWITNYEQTLFKRTKSQRNQYEISFETSVDIHSGSMISIDFGSDFTLQRCWGGRNLVFEKEEESCSVVGQKLVLKKFKDVLLLTEISINFEALNPSVIGPSQDIQVNIYSDDVSNLLYSQSQLFQIEIELSQDFSTTSLQIGTVKTDELFNPVITFQVPQTLLAVEKLFILSFQKRYFSLESETFQVELFNNNVQTTVDAVTVFQNEDYFTIHFKNTSTSFLSGEAHKVQVTSTTPVVRTPFQPGSYNILFQIQSTQNYSQAITLNIAAQNGILKGFSYTIDQSKKSVYRFTFDIEFKLQKGFYSQKEQDQFSYIQLYFAKQNDCFKQDLGTGFNNEDPIPCYGHKDFKSDNVSNTNLLQCTLKHDNTIHPNFAMVIVKGYQRLQRKGEFLIFLPNIENPKNVASQCEIKAEIYNKKEQKNDLVWFGTVNMTNMKETNVFRNQKNTNGPLGVSTNQNTVYSPKTVSLRSDLELKITAEKELESGGGMMVFVPQLPQTNFRSFLLPLNHESSCQIDGEQVECYSFPEARILLLVFYTTMLKNKEITIKIFNCINPSFVLNLEKGMILRTFNTIQEETEEFLFPNLEPFNYGQIKYSIVRPSNYDAWNINTRYEWVFVLSNSIPKGGYITLYFPSNFYNLEESIPCPQITLKKGLVWKDASSDINKQPCSSKFQTSTVSLKNIGEFTTNKEERENLVVIWIEGVRNPAEEGWTPYFGVSTHNELGFMIDRLLEIPRIYIQKQNETGQIVFSRFEAIPDNGKIISDYYLGFSITKSLPKNSKILIKLSNTDYTSSFSKYKECIVLKGISSYLSCTFDAAEPTITLILDENLQFQFSQHYILLVFPGIQNIKADMRSSPIEVLTIYDNSVLDKSGTEEDNRVIISKEEAKVISVSSFVYFPQNSDSFVDFSLSFTIEDPTDIHSIQINLPIQFKGIKSEVHCESKELDYDEFDQIRCKFHRRKIIVENSKSLTECPCTVNLKIFGVLVPAWNFQNAIDSISIYVFKSQNHLYGFNYDIGAIVLLKESNKCSQKNLIATSQEPTEFYSLKSHLTCTSFVYDQFRVIPDPNSFSRFYNKASQINLASSGIKDLTRVHNYLVFNLEAQSVLIQGFAEIVEVSNIMQSFNLTEKSFVHFQYLDKLSGSIVGETVDNLISSLGLPIEKKKSVLKGLFEVIELNSGMYTNEVKMTPDSFNGDTPIVPETYDNFVEFDSSDVKFQNEKFSFRIKSKELTKEKHTYLSFSFQTNYYKVPPTKVIVSTKTKKQIVFDDFGGVAIGGFVGPIQISLENSSYSPLDISFLFFNNKNSIINTLPLKLTFQNSERMKSFYLVSHYTSKISSGYFLMQKTGDQKHLFNFQNSTNRVQFKIFEGNYSEPRILNFKYSFQNPQERPKQELIEDGDHQEKPTYSQTLFPAEKTLDLSISFKFDSQVIIHYALYPRNTQLVTFLEIYNKKLNSDDFGSWVHFGSQLMEDNLNFEMDLVIQNVTVDEDFILRAYPVDIEGKIGLAFEKKISTRNINDPFAILIELNSQGKSQDQILDHLKQEFVFGTHLQNVFNSQEFPHHEERIKISNKIHKISEDSLFVPVEEVKKETEVKQTEQRDFYIYQSSSLTEKLNHELKIERDIQSYTNFGMSQSNHEEFLLDYKILQSQKTYFDSEGREFTSSEKQFQVKEPEALFLNDVLSFDFMPSFSFFRFFFTPSPDVPSYEAKQQIRNKIQDLLQRLPDIKGVHLYSLKRKAVEWHSKKPKLDQIKDTSIIISGLQVKEKATLYFSVQELVRTEYKNQLQPDKKHFIVYQEQNLIKRKCLENSSNPFEIKCFPENNSFYNDLKKERAQKDIYDFVKLFHQPSNQNVKRGLDPNNFVALKSGSLELEAEQVHQLEIGDLPQEKNLVIFMVLQRNIGGLELFSDEDEMVSFTFRIKKKLESVAEILRMVVLSLFLLQF